ncbi:MAG: bifunctional nuclease family protein [Bacteroidales bacterium]|nr:bifunctional nuclease family protein [Bacteroidales bacterium]
MNKIELSVADIHAATQQSEAFYLILKEKEGSRYVPVIIGMSEARAILVELNQSPTHRPLTHELFITLADNFLCSLVEVDIIHHENGVYYADMLMKRDDDTVFHIDARPSDAIALALKSNAPFFMNTDIFEKTCQIDESQGNGEIITKEYNEVADLLSENEEDLMDTEAFIDQKLKEMSVSELQHLLEGAVENEDFELAEKIQKEIEKR